MPENALDILGKRESTAGERGREGRRERRRERENS